MSDLLKRNEVWVFLCGIVVVNALFVGGIASEILPFALYSTGRFLLLAGVLFAVVFLARGVPGVLDVLRPMLRWRVSPLWYLLAIVWAAANSILVLMIKGAMNGNGLAEVTASFELVSRFGVMKVILIGSFIGEIVWVSYAVRRLSATFTPYVSAMITGAFWAAWWVPMVILNIGVVPDLPVTGLLINQMGVAAMCAFFYFHTRSGLVVLLMQVMFNSTILVFPVAPATGGMLTYMIFAVVYFLTALGLFLAFGPKPLFSRSEGYDGRRVPPESM